MATTSTERKYASIENSSSLPASIKENSEQLIYPIDFAGGYDHPGLAVIFEFNKLTNTKTRDYEKGLTPSAGAIKTSNSRGVLNTEVTMQETGSSSTTRGSLRNAGGGYTKTPISIVLPPPDQWNDTLISNWQNSEMGSIGRAGDMINSVKEEEYKAALNQIGSSLPKMLAGAIQSAGGPNLRSFSELITGEKANAYSEVLFSAVSNRFFPFQWTFTPRNRREAEVIRALIHRFRWAMLPELSDPTGKNASFYRVPWTFDIHFVNVKTGKESEWWPKIGTCALTNVQVNKTPQGEFAVLGDDIDSEVPAAIVLELQFTELFTLSKENLEDIKTSY